MGTSCKSEVGLMDPVTIAYICFGTLWVMGAITYLQIIAKTPSNEYFTPVKKRTSIGNSSRSKPKNKHKIKSWKKYNRQGKR